MVVRKYDLILTKIRKMVRMLVRKYNWILPMVRQTVPMLLRKFDFILSMVRKMTRILVRTRFGNSFLKPFLKIDEYIYLIIIFYS